MKISEKEKAALGMLYDANYDKNLEEERLACSVQTYKYNNLLPSAISEKTEIMKSILGGFQENFRIEQPFRCDYGYNIEIGNNFYANFNLIILDAARVTFGDNIFIAPNCGFYTAGHPFDIEARNIGLEYAYPITVGDDVWIGSSVCVLPGVSIGSGCVIAAGSVVNKDIPPNCLAAGNPCRVIREISEADRQKYK